MERIPTSDAVKHLLYSYGFSRQEALDVYDQRLVAMLEDFAGRVAPRPEPEVEDAGPYGPADLRGLTIAALSAKAVKLSPGSPERARITREIDRRNREIARASGLDASSVLDDPEIEWDRPSRFDLDIDLQGQSSITHRLDADGIPF